MVWLLSFLTISVLCHVCEGSVSQCSGSGSGFSALIASSCEYDPIDYLVLYEETALPGSLRVKSFAKFLNSDSSLSSPGNVMGYLGSVDDFFVRGFDCGTNTYFEEGARIGLIHTVSSNLTMQISFDFSGQPREVIDLDSDAWQTSYSITNQLDRASVPAISGTFRMSPQLATNLISQAEVNLEYCKTLGDWLSLFYGQDFRPVSLQEYRWKNLSVDAQMLLVDGLTENLALIIYEIKKPTRQHILTWWLLTDNEWNRLTPRKGFESINEILRRCYRPN